MWKQHELVMLSTNEKAKMWLNKFSNQLHIDTVEKENHENAINQHLYFLSTEEIKEGDWYYWSVTNTIQKAIKDSLGRLPKIEDGSKKIIDTTDSSLRIGKLEVGGKIEHLPQIPQSFIELYVYMYNKGNVITKVMVEYEEAEEYDRVYGHENKFPRLKINSDNTINIKPIISTSEEIGEKIVQYCKKYEGTNKYNDILKAIEFGYNLQSI